MDTASVDTTPKATSSEDRPWLRCEEVYPLKPEGVGYCGVVTWKPVIEGKVPLEEKDIERCSREEVVAKCGMHCLAVLPEHDRLVDPRLMPEFREATEEWLRVRQPGGWSWALLPAIILFFNFFRLPDDEKVNFLIMLVCLIIAVLLLSFGSSWIRTRIRRGMSWDDIRENRLFRVWLSRRSASKSAIIFVTLGLGLPVFANLRNLLHPPHGKFALSWSEMETGENFQQLFTSHIAVGNADLLAVHMIALAVGIFAILMLWDWAYVTAVGVFSGVVATFLAAITHFHDPISGPIGAAFGLLGFSVVAIWKKRDVLPGNFFRYTIYTPLLVPGILGAALYWDKFQHWGGLLCGMTLGWLWARKAQGTPVWRSGKTMKAAALFLGAAWVIVCVEVILRS